jgi:hypothetical protein
MNWWSEDARERYWLEATDRADIGADLRAPLADSSGQSNWRYTMFRDARPGDIVFHYDGKAGAITSRSVIAGPPFDQPITWAARGSYARERHAVPVEVDGYAVPLADHVLLAQPVTLEQLRAEKSVLVEMDRVLRSRHPRQPIYFPFELSARPVRPMQGYAFKLPASFVKHFGLDTGLPVGPQLRISDDRRKVPQLFRRWRAALMEGAVRSGGLWQQAGDRFVFRNEDERRADQPGPNTALGIDPTGRDWAVQINEADEPGDLNLTSAIALDAAARPYLVRQGRLAANSTSRKPILYAEFARLTGLAAARITNGDTAIRRDWYIVTPLDIDAAQIRRNTARFVDACADARLAARGSADAPMFDPPNELSAPDEAGGFYTTGAREALPERQLCRLQGEVWMAMAKMLREAGLDVGKPRHSAGYEVDAEIRGTDCNLLVEIKSEAGASAVHTGIGQLLLYPALLPRLARHRRVLLLPDLPSPALVSAVAQCGVMLCTYSLKVGARSAKVEFSPAFLELCGLEALNRD